MLVANELDRTLQYFHWQVKYFFIKNEHKICRFQHSQYFQQEFVNYWLSSYDLVWKDTGLLSILRSRSYAIFACSDIDFTRFDFSIVPRPYRVTSKQCSGILRRIGVKRGWNDAFQDFQALAEEAGRNRTGQHLALVVPINRVSKEAEPRFGFWLNIENNDTTWHGWRESMIYRRANFFFSDWLSSVKFTFLHTHSQKTRRVLIDRQYFHEFARNNGFTCSFFSRCFRGLLNSFEEFSTRNLCKFWHQSSVFN